MVIHRFGQLVVFPLVSTTSALQELVICLSSCKTIISNNSLQQLVVIPSIHHNTILIKSLNHNTTIIHPSKNSTHQPYFSPLQKHMAPSTSHGWPHGIHGSTSSSSGSSSSPGHLGGLLRFLRAAPPRAARHLRHLQPLGRPRRTWGVAMGRSPWWRCRGEAMAVGKPWLCRGMPWLVG